MWIQFLSVLVIFFFIFIFDWAFTNESNFLFDPDADNWRRKVVSRIDTERLYILFFGEYSLSSSLLLFFSFLLHIPGGTARVNACFHGRH